MPSNAPSGQAGTPHEVYYRFAGRQMGFTGNNGTDDQNAVRSVTERGTASQANPGTFRGGSVIGSPYADFLGSYDPINSFGQGSAAGSYTVRAGDSLQGIAAALYGDGNLWYKIAEANGLSGAAGLSEGQQLRLPTGLMKSGYNASTFTPYDASEAIGDTLPSAAKPPKSPKCGGFGQILMIAIAVAVSAITYGALTGPATTLLGAIGAGAVSGAAGSTASQGFGVTTGIQDKFSFKGVAMAAISGAVGAGFGKGLDGLSKLGDAKKLADGTMKAARSLSGVESALKSAGTFLSSKTDIVAGAVRSAMSSAITQGVSVAAGLQKSFSWTNVAAAGVAGGLSNAIGGGLPALAEGLATITASATMFVILAPMEPPHLPMRQRAPS